jgi:hypothetical protein
MGNCFFELVIVIRNIVQDRGDSSDPTYVTISVLLGVVALTLGLKCLEYPEVRSLRTLRRLSLILSTAPYVIPLGTVGYGINLILGFVFLASTLVAALEEAQ